MIIRGSELLRHKWAMFIGTIWCAVLSALMGVVLWLWIAPPVLDFFENHGWTYYRAYWVARAYVAIGHTKGVLMLPGEYGERQWEVTQILSSPTIQEFVSDVNVKLVEIGHDALIAAASGFIVWMIVAWLYGHHAGKDLPVAGMRIVEKVRYRLRQLLTRWRWSPYQIGGVRLPKNGETLHLLLAGSTGTGKTIAILDLLDQIRSRGDAAVIFDPDGTFISHFYRHQHDILMNPLDSRMPLWTPWADCFEPQHYDDLADGMMARDPRESGESIWDIGAAQFIAGSLESLKRDSLCTNEHLYQFLATRPLEEIEPLLQDLPAGVVMNKAIERTALSVRFTAMKRAAALRYLHDSTDGTSFSIRRFVHDPADRWLFLSARADMRAMLRPLLSTWLHLATTALLSLKPSPTRRLWFIIDEAASLNRIPSLGSLLQEGRRFGGCAVVGLQALSQVQSIYGDNEATSLLAIPQTTLALRTPDHKTAELMAKRLGEQVFIEMREATQYGAHATRDGVSLTHQYTKRYPVEPAELQCLPDRTGYLRLPGPLPLVRVTLPVRRRQVIAEPFVPREIPRSVQRTQSEPTEMKDQEKEGQGKQAKKGKDIDSGLSGLARDLAEPDGLPSC